MVTTSMVKKKLVPIAIIVLAVCIVGIFVGWIGLQSTTVMIHNDTPNGVIASLCGSDVVTIQPGARAKLMVKKNNPKEACAIQDSKGQYLGCLAIPTDQQGLSFDVSNVQTAILEKACGS